MTTRRERTGKRTAKPALRCVAAFLGAALCASVLVNATSVTTATAAGVPSVAVPAYYWPGVQWDALLNAGSEVKYTVLNPNSGPDTQVHAGFVDVVARARAKGFTVVGYVDTAYGTRAASLVEADIASYRLFYGINQFFFDQTPSACSSLPYYTALETFVQQSANGFIIHNPGTNPGECYLDVADIVVNFEGTETSYATWDPAPYVASYAANRFWNIVYDVTATNGSSLMNLASQRNIGFVYITDDGLPNPFDRIPVASLWQAQVPSARPPRGAAPQAPGVSSGGRGSAPQAGPSVTTPTTVVPPSAPPLDDAAAPPVVAPPVVVVPPMVVPPMIVPPTIAPAASVAPSDAAASDVPAVGKVFDDFAPESMTVFEGPKPIVVDVLGEAIRAVSVALAPVAGPLLPGAVAGPVFLTSAAPSMLGLRVVPVRKAPAVQRKSKAKHLAKRVKSPKSIKTRWPVPASVAGTRR